MIPACPGPTKAPALDRIAVDATGAAALFSMSERAWRRLDSAGLVPAPIRLRGSVRWNVDELRAWSHAGAPPRARWEERRRECLPA